MYKAVQGKGESEDKGKERRERRKKDREREERVGGGQRGVVSETIHVHLSPCLLSQQIQTSPSVSSQCPGPSPR